jgi:hypothetical protein
MGRLSLLFSPRRQDFEFRSAESSSTAHGRGQITPKGMAGFAGVIETYQTILAHPVAFGAICRDLGESA